MSGKITGRYIVHEDEFVHAVLSVGLAPHIQHGSIIPRVHEFDNAKESIVSLEEGVFYHHLLPGMNSIAIKKMLHQLGRRISSGALWRAKT